MAAPLAMTPTTLNLDALSYYAKKFQRLRVDHAHGAWVCAPKTLCKAI